MARHKTIAFVAPADRLLPERFAALKEAAAQFGVDAIYAPNITNENGRFAGGVEERARVLADVARYPNLLAVVSTCGGYGSSHLIEHVRSIESDAAFVGYSDITYLLNCEPRLKFRSFIHGPMLVDFERGNDLGLKYLMSYLAGEPLLYDARTSPSVQVVRTGRAQGEIVGGNLSVLCSMLGTPHFPNLAGKILLIEEVGEVLYKLDRMLLQLKRAGVFDSLAGLVAGSFENILDSSKPYPIAIREILEIYTQCVGGPTVLYFPAGHGKLNMPIPLHTDATLLATSDSWSLRIGPVS